MAIERTFSIIKPDAVAKNVIGEIISRFEIPNRGRGPTWAHPVVCGGRLYIRHGDYLYCYAVGASG